MIKIKDILKVSMGFSILCVTLIACSSHKMAMNAAAEDPIYTTESDIKLEGLKEAAAIKRAQLDAGYATSQGKKSGIENGKYDYMPATSYGQRFNRMGNSFFLNDPYYSSNNFYGRSSGSSVIIQVSNGYSPMYNPYMNNYGYNPWRCGYNDPYMSYYRMQTSYYPFFTYNPYMFSYTYAYGYNDPWMMQNTFYDPYFYNPYYSYNPYGYGFGNPYCNTYRTSYKSTAPSYVNQRRANSAGGNSSTAGSNNSNTSYSRDRTTTTTETGNNSGSNRGMESSGSRGGYNSNNRADRSSTTTHQGSTRR